LLGSADYVLIDCPPVLPVTDATVLSSRVDGTLLVATANETSQKALRHARETLGRVNAPLLGVVFNGVTESTGYGYSYSYRYYGSSSGESNGREVREAAAGR
jgi:Mrp family chromosome partitioning ATPase